jgi:hypothetical protein
MYFMIIHRHYPTYVTHLTHLTERHFQPKKYGAIYSLFARNSRALPRKQNTPDRVNRVDTLNTLDTPDRVDTLNTLDTPDTLIEKDHRLTRSLSRTATGVLLTRAQPCDSIAVFHSFGGMRILCRGVS